jgi:STE24 endopeptidase
MNFANPYFTVILFSVIALEVLETVASMMNLKRLTPALPRGLEDVYEAEAYARSQAYARENERFDIFSGLIKLAVFMLFWLSGGFGWLDGLVRSWTDSPVWQAVAGIAILGLASIRLVSHLPAGGEIRI